MRPDRVSPLVQRLLEDQKIGDEIVSGLLEESADSCTLRLIVYRWNDGSIPWPSPEDFRVEIVTADGKRLSPAWADPRVDGHGSAVAIEERRYTFVRFDITSTQEVGVTNKQGEAVILRLRDR